MNRILQSIIMLVVTLSLLGVPPAAHSQRGGGGRGGGAQTSVNRNENSNRNYNSNTNVNRNVNVNTNVNVNVHGGYGGCCYHPVATAVAATAAVAVTAAVIGSVVHSVPPSCSVVVVSGLTYQQCGSTWYQPQFAGTSTTYIVVAAPQ